MYNGYNKIFWGLIIATFNINFGGIKILPAFIGFMIILSGANSLYKATQIKDFKKACNLLIIIIFISILRDISSFMLFSSWNILLNESIIIIDIILEVVVFYKCMKGTIIYLNDNGYVEVAEANVGKQRFYIIVSIVNIIILNLTFAFKLEILIVLTGIIFFIIRIYLMTLFRGIRNIFRGPNMY